MAALCFLHWGYLRVQNDCVRVPGDKFQHTGTFRLLRNRVQAVQAHC